MRDYAKVSPKMWHGKTTKELRRRGYEALLVGLYLMTSPNSNMLGLFSQPILYMAHETGLGIEGATKGLRGCIDAGFCAYDDDTEFVFVFEMARYQIDSKLSLKDLRCKGIQKEYEGLPDNPFLGAFFDRYADSFHMTFRREYGSLEEAPYQAPSKPLRSQEQEQEQEQEQDIVPPSADKTKPSANSSDRGSRLPGDWELPEDWAAWCEQNRPDLEPRAVAEAFRDFWVAKPGKDGRKADWLATWRNWCRSQKPGNRAIVQQERGFV